MKTNRITALLLLSILLVGCNSSFTRTEQPTTILISKTQTGNTPASQEITPDDEKESKLFNFYKAPGDEISQDQIPSDCKGFSNLTYSKFIDTKGLVVYDTTTQQLLVLNDSGIENPLYSIEAKSPDSIITSWGVSPDGQWMSYLDYLDVNLYDIWIENIKTGEKINKHFDGRTISWSDIYWANDQQIVIPLRNNGDLFQWIVWDPFENSENRVSAKLTGIDYAIEKIGIFPIYNPNTRTILYACNQCGDNEFQIYDLNVKKITRSIDFGKGPFADIKWAPYYSPNMKFTAFHFGGNKIWIFDQNYDSVLKITLPFVEYLSWTGGKFRWSNDGKYLAMFRENPGTPQYYLSILDVEHETMENICAQIPPSTLQWSHDNRYIIAMRDRSVDDTEGTLSIIDVNTGEGETMTIKDDGYLVGWLEP